MLVSNAASWLALWFQLLEGGSEESAQLDIARLASNAASLPVSAWRCCRLAMLERCGSMYNTRNIGAESH